MTSKGVKKKVINKWVEKLYPQLKRKTSRTNRCRLILSVERQVFPKKDGFHACRWNICRFKELNGNFFGHIYQDRWQLDSWPATKFQCFLLTKYKQLLNEDIKRTEIKEERESWDESAGGEAFIGEENDKFQAFYRVQCFDPFLFTDRFQFDQLRVRINQPTEFRKATKYDFLEDSIPFHPNVIKNIANVELFHKNDEHYVDCLGWITLMEKGEQNLHRLLRNEIPTIEQRRLLAIDLRKGLQYLFEIGLEHNDLKLENIVLFGETPKWIDFGVICDTTGNESYRRMGYVRRGSKFRNVFALASGTPGFCNTHQIIGGMRGTNRDDAQDSIGKRLFFFLFCDWKTAWTLLFKPIMEEEKAEITQLLESINARWLTPEMKYSTWNTSDDTFEAVTAIASYKKANDWFILDTNLTKSLGLAELNRKLRRCPTVSSQNITRHPLDQGGSNLCVPVNLTTLLRHAIKEHCPEDNLRKTILGWVFTSEKILYFLTMKLYPRSLAGLNYNPDEEEIEYQRFRRFEDLLERMVKPTYQHAFETGWEWMRRSLVQEFYRDNLNFLKGSVLNYTKVNLHSSYDWCRPLTVTGYRKDINDNVIEHQMVVDRVEENHEKKLVYVIYDQNFEQRIALDKPLYYKDFIEYLNASGNKVTDHNMELNEFYLGQTAFTVQIKLP